MSAPPATKLGPDPRLDITPDHAVRRLGQELGLSAKDMAGALGVDRRTLGRWLAGDTHPRRNARHRLIVLLRLDERLRGTFTDREAVHSWLNGPNRYLRGTSPIDEIRAGRFDRVDGALEVIDSGIFV